MLRNFDTDLDTTGQQRMVTPRPEPVVQITQTVTSMPRSSAAAYVAKSDERWGWDDLRDYVVAQIEGKFGPFPRDVRKEAGIFKSFVARHPEHAAAIARYAFETSGGFWMGAPIQVTRFCKGSDPYFAEPIVKRLTDVSTPVQGW